MVSDATDFYSWHVERHSSSRNWKLSQHSAKESILVGCHRYIATCGVARCVQGALWRGGLVKPNVPLFSLSADVSAAPSAASTCRASFFLPIRNGRGGPSSNRNRQSHMKKNEVRVNECEKGQKKYTKTNNVAEKVTWEEADDCLKSSTVAAERARTRKAPRCSSRRGC